MVIAIDGPSGVGKSTVARAVADRLGVAYLDTGSTYRAATLVAIEAGVDPHDEEAVLAALVERTIDYDDRGIVLDGEPVAEQIRSEAVTGAVSAVSALPAVRTAIVEVQRRWVAAHGGRAVVEGRDIGTVVFPDASPKVFLTASPLVRAQRRALDAEAGGRPVEEIAAALAERDEADSTRATSPLRPAADATIIDTGDLSIEAVVTTIVDLVGV